MEYRYILSQNIYEGQNSQRNSFGIALACEDDSIMSILQTVSDISSDRARVEALVLACNSFRLSPVHLPDVVSDLLNNL